jgi:hypothetical protein
MTKIEGEPRGMSKIGDRLYLVKNSTKVEEFNIKNS